MARYVDTIEQTSLTFMVNQRLFVPNVPKGDSDRWLLPGIQGAGIH